MSTEWLRSIKQGDRVVVVCRQNASIQTVDRVTPTGRFVVGRTTYDQFGRERGGDVWNSARLEPVTPEREQMIRRKALVVRMLNLKWGDVASDKLERIAAILDEKAGA